MTLTQEEKLLLAKLRKRQDQWHTERWILLAVGVFGVAGGVGTTWAVLHAASEFPRPVDPLLYAMLLPPCYLLLLGGAWAFRQVLFAWKGDAVVALLLKLIAEIGVEEDVE